MADQGSGGGNKSETGEALSGVWLVLGFVIGVSLSTKYVQSIGYAMDEDLPWPQVGIAITLFFGPVVLLVLIAEQLRKEVLSGKSTWATYWTTMITITLPALAIAGVSTFDDILKVFHTVW